MKRLWFRFATPRRLSAVWLCNAFAVLIVTLSPLFVLTPASARPAPPSGGGGNVPGGGTVTATFLDANHIGIVATGNVSFSYTDGSGNTFNVTTSLYPVQGIYYGSVSPYPSWGSGYGGNMPNPGIKYWFQNNQSNPGGNVCSGHNTTIQINSFDPKTGNATGTLYMHVPVVDNQSTNPTPTCEPTDPNGIVVQNLQILNIGANTGGTFNSFQITDNYSGQPAYSTLTLADVASSANFYESGGSIFASVYDPSIGANGGTGGEQMYQFTNPTTNKDGSTTYHQGVGGYVSKDCPDAITVPKGALGIWIKATYSTWVNSNSSGYGNTCSSTNVNKPAATYPILLLTETPQAYFSSISGTASTGGTTGTGGTQSGAASNGLPDCTAGGGSIFTKVLNWILCGAINLAFGAASLLDTWIMTELNVDVSNIFSTSNGGDGQSYYAAWNSFRIIATGLLIVAGLVMVAAEAFGVELLDAYTIRKVLPRLVIAVIGISLSWPLMEFVIKFFDTAGVDFRAIMYAPFASALGTNLTPTGTGSGLAILGAGAALLVLGPATLTFLLTALLASFVGFMILIIRRIAIIMLVILAPIAIACYILPGTQKGWKLWYDNFLGLMLMFPIISMLIAAGHIFAVISFKQGGNAAEKTISEAVGLIAWFAPYFMLPMAARMATGMIGNLAGFVNDRHKGAFDRLKGVRSNAAAKNTAKMKAGNRFSDRNPLTKGFNRVSAGVGTGWQGRFGVGKRGAAAVDQVRRNAAANQVMKSEGFAAIQEDDEALRAATYDSAREAKAALTQRYMDAGKGRATAEADAERAVAAAQASIGFGRPQAIAAAQQLATTGTGYENMEDQATTIARASGGDKSTATSIAGYNNFINKQKGRYDLAPGAGKLAGLATGEIDHNRGGAGPSMADYHASVVQGARSADPVTMLRGKEKEVKTLTGSLGDHARGQYLRMTNAQAQGNAKEAAAAQDEFIQTMGQIDQLKQSKSYASHENQEHVNALDNETADLQQNLGTMMGIGVMGPHTQAQAQEHEAVQARYNQVRSPRVNPNDPNNPGP